MTAPGDHRARPWRAALEQRVRAASMRRFEVIDAHTAGEPLRVIVSGFPRLPGSSVLERRRLARERHEPLRRALMLEPRGHADMYGCLLVPPERPGSDVGVLFLHNDGYSTMCGHGIIGLVTVGLECALFEPADRSAIRIDTPAGLVVATAHEESGRVVRVSFRNVPSFVLERRTRVDVPGLGAVVYDLAFGGAFYAYVDLDGNAALAGLDLSPAATPRLIDTGRKIKQAVSAIAPPNHPSGEAEVGFLYGVIFVAASTTPGVHSRNVCVFADGEVDRSPTGTGVSGRAAIHHARGELARGESITIESILGTTFEVRVVDETAVGSLPAVVPEVTGSAHLTGRAELLVDPGDPLAEGFLLR